MFIIELLSGEEIIETKGDTLDINPNTGVVTVSRVDGNEASATHYSPVAWSQVKHRVQRSVVPVSPAPLVTQIYH